MTLPVVVDTGLLGTDELEKLNTFSAELNHAFTHRQIFRTETEARISVLDDLHFPTRASKYWQTVREQMGMLESLALLSYDYRRNEVAIKRHTLRIESLDPLVVEEAQIDIDECLYKRASMKTVAADRVREISMWSKLKNELVDGSFDGDNVDTHQLISYTTLFILRAAQADKARMTGGEWDNLAGQLQTAISRCIDVGVLDRVLANVPPAVAKEFLPA